MNILMFESYGKAFKSKSGCPDKRGFKKNVLPMFYQL